MTQNERNSLAATILEINKIYGKDISKTEISEQLNILEKYFSNKSFQDLENAFKKYFEDIKNTQAPTIQSLRKYLDHALDEDSVAIDAAARAIKAIDKFGWNNGKAAREYMGEVAWQAVTSFGGWANVCADLGVNIDVTTFSAQIRNISKTIIKSKDLHSSPALDFQNKISGSLGAAPSLKSLRDPDQDLSNSKNEQVENLIQFMKKEISE
jgi:hypothetical protein